MTHPFPLEVVLDLKWRQRLILVTALAFVLAHAFAGPLRMYLASAGLSPLIYIPNVMMMAAIAWQIVAEPHARGFTALTLIALLAPLYGITVGLQYMPLFQVGMGVYVLLPLWFGLSCGQVLWSNWRALSRFLPLLWIAVVGGILVNQIVEYPWEGFEYNVASLDVEGARQWYAGGGNKRLAGLARSSFDAATHIHILGLLLALSTRSALIRTVIWCVTLYAIIPSNSKGILATSVVLTPLVIFRRALPESLYRVLPPLFGLIALSLPLATLLFEFNNQFSNPTLANATYSFYDRLNYMWPEAWDLLSHNGHALLGRGIGGIGTAQTYFESALFNAGDNIFMYWFVVFGWAAFPAFVLVLLKSLRLRPFRSEVELRVYALLLAMLAYGAMTNIVENAMLALVCGMVVRWLCSTPERQMAMDALPSQSTGELIGYAR
jgi:hypothetical protein